MGKFHWLLFRFRTGWSLFFKMLAKPSPPRFEVQIVIIIIIITIFLCVAFLYYSISVNFFGVWRSILLSRVLAISWRLHHIQWPPKYICTIQKAFWRVAWKTFISIAFVSIFEWFALEIGSYVRTSYPSYWFVISVGTVLKQYLYSCGSSNIPA